MWIAVGIAVGTGLAAIFLAVKYRLLKKCIRQAGLDLTEIMDSPEENRILLATSPSREAERLLRQINRYMEYHQRERVVWQQRERMLQEQIENISHDLRTPLTSILGYLELVDDEDLSEEDREALAVVERKSRYLQALIRDFYDLSRLEKSDRNLRSEKVDIIRMLQETVLSYYPVFEERHLEVKLDLPRAPVLLRGNAEALERILHNMIQNALRYAHSYFQIRVSRKDAMDKWETEPVEGCRRSGEKTETGRGDDGREEQQSYAGENRVCLDFCNDAEHLTQEDIPYLFDRFYTADHVRPSGSTGLGLTISRLLAEAMGGAATARLTQRKELHLLFELCPAPERDL